MHRLEKERNKKAKTKGKSTVPSTPTSSAPPAIGNGGEVVSARDRDREREIPHIHGEKTHLANVRVIQRNLVYVIGLVSPLNTDDVCVVIMHRIFMIRH